MRLNRFMIRPLVEAGLREELNAGDTTGGFLVWEHDPVLTGQIYAKGSGIVCGLMFAEETVKLVEPEAQVEYGVQEGAPIGPGTVLLKIRAKASTFFMIERAALDWVQQLSGIATKTRRYVRLVDGLGVRITDTRKGVPGCRVFQKYAVRLGGAHNHLFGLHNCILVKDNHIKAAGGVTRAVQTLKAKAQHTFKIEIECESLEMVKEALAAGADIIMLDNMTMDEMREAIRFIDRRVPVEVSGGIREQNIVEMARLGPDVISVGDLTRNVQTVDVSLDVGEIKSSALRQIRTGEAH